MARAGFCSGCGTYVYLRPDGACVNGHDPAAVSAVYEAPDELAPPAAFAAPAQQPPAYAPPAQPYAQPQQYAAPAQPYAPPAQPVYPAAAPVAAPPKKKRGGLIAVVLIVLLLICGGGGVFAAVSAGLIPNPADMLASAEHQKVAAAADFVEALSTANPVLFRKSLPTDAATAADPVYWVKKLAEATGQAKLESKSWQGDTLTMVFVASDGTKRQFVLSAEPGNEKVKAIASDAGQAASEGDGTLLEMTKELAGYKVRALLGSDGSEFIRFTPEQIKKFETENP
ncbi:MAG: hypothetical protein Q7W30_00830 [Coriobacteriia bacterium]|nr:hypothetical protein [Coriobacteriia bacterium]